MLFILQSELKQRKEIPFILAGKLNSFPTCTAYNFIPLYVMDQHCVENKEKVSSSDCDEDEDEYEDFNLLTVFNEHSEVIGLIKDDKNTNLPILKGQNSVPNSYEIEIFDPPPDNPESDSHDSDENNAHSEENEDASEEDQECYMVYQVENNVVENNIHLSQIPIVNYVIDVEHEEDFGNGWEWTERDPGSSCRPFISQPGLFIETSKSFSQPTIR